MAPWRHAQERVAFYGPRMLAEVIRYLQYRSSGAGRW
jgi:hypothetical protein